MNCPYCGSINVDYLGIADGGGDYGDAICDEWVCDACAMEFEGDCIASEDGVEDDE